MSVIVKNMEMPKNCAECKMWSICECLNDFEDFESICYAVEDGDLIRDKNCPLIELPPHGRLGDLDALYEEISNGNKAYNGIEGYGGKYPNIANVDDCLDAIKYADTVIEAEGETDGR